MKRYVYFVSARVRFTNGDEAYVNNLCDSERMIIDNDAMQSFTDDLLKAIEKKTKRRVSSFVIMSLNYLHSIEGALQ